MACLSGNRRKRNESGAVSLRFAVRRWLRIPVDGDALLREARYANLCGTTALIFTRGLDHDELVAIEQAWARRPSMPAVPPADTNPGTVP